MKGKLLTLWLSGLTLSAIPVSAHCPLCTVGAAVAAGGAAWLGVDQVVIGLFVGAFAVSMGWWIANLIKKRIIPGQKFLIILLSFLTTVIPILPLMKGVYPLYLSVIGEYGSILNRTYVLNLFLMGSILGSMIVSLTPSLSSYITEKRNTTIPFQGTILTLAMLIIIGTVMQLFL